MTMQAQIHGVTEIERRNFDGFQCIYLGDRGGSKVVLFVEDRNFDAFAGKMRAALGHRGSITLSLPDEAETTPEDQLRLLRTLEGV